MSMKVKIPDIKDCQDVSEDIFFTGKKGDLTKSFIMKSVFYTYQIEYLS